MSDILQEIVAWKRIEVAQQKELLAPATLHAQVEQMLLHPTPRRSMRQSLASSPTGIIAEFKRKSPSKGWIKVDGTPEAIPPSYEQAGASALSILTDEKYFGGHMDFIRRARPLVSLPILRKDFVVDEYQLFQARAIGADAVLLIASVLSLQECKSLIDKAHELQLEVLLEMHGEGELDYATLEADMLGINNRHLGTFHTDVQNSFDIAEKLPQDALLVSESGIGKPDTIRQLRQAGFRGFLMGEHFMRAEDPGQALASFIGELTKHLNDQTE